jgi:hypothetical protein
MKMKFPQIFAAHARLIELIENLRSRNYSVFVKQTQRADESETLAQLGALSHSHPRTFCRDLPIQHNCTDLSAIIEEVNKYYSVKY